MTPDEPYINCYIWEVKQYPKFGREFNHFLINDFYHYNSLTDLREDKQLSPYIQIPEYFVRCSDENRKYVMENLKTIVDEQIPIIKKINDDLWGIDLSFIEKKK